MARRELYVEVVLKKPVADLQAGAVVWARKQIKQRPTHPPKVYWWIWHENIGSHVRAPNSAAKKLRPGVPGILLEEVLDRISENTAWKAREK